jgi:hypothetical protein
MLVKRTLEFQAHMGLFWLDLLGMISEFCLLHVVVA